MNRHPLDAVSLVFGLLFAVLGTATLVAPQVPIGWLRSPVVLPVVVVLAGVALLASSLRRSRIPEQPPPPESDRELADAAVEREQAGGEDRP